MAITGVYSNMSALSALSTGMQVTANNIANVNTNEFKYSRADLETGPKDQGVYVSQIPESSAAGSLVPSLQPVENPDTGRTTTREVMVESSNTDLAREFVNLISAQRAYEANIAAIQTFDELGQVVNELV